MMMILLVQKLNRLSFTRFSSTSFLILNKSAFSSKNLLSIGDTFSISKTFTNTDIEMFAELSQDFNPLHMDEEFAKKSKFGQRIVHGALTSSLISGLLGSKVFEPGAIYVSQQVKFTAPLFIGENVTATATVIDKRKNKVTLSFRCETDDKKIVIQGEGVVIAPK